MLEVSDTHLELLRSILKQFFKDPNHDFLLFGSRVVGNARRDSDLDVAVKSKNPIPKGLVTQAKSAFEESSLPFTVDLVDYSSVSSDFKRVIDATGIPIPAVIPNR